MKIGVLLSSYENTNSAFEKYEYQDPSRYISNHEFQLLFITKNDACKQLDDIKKENFDILINFLWGQHYDNVAGIDAVAYAETLGIPIIGTSSKFLSLSKIDFKLAASKYNILTPKYNIIRSPEDVVTLDTFPLIVKPARGCGSLHMTRNSVCKNAIDLKNEIRKMLNVAGCELLVEEYIYGGEYSTMVIENTDGVYALNPLVYEFPDHYSPEEQFLDFDNKFELVDTGEIKIKFVDKTDPLYNQIKEIACKSYNALHVHGSGYARVDFRVDDKNNIYVLEINPAPAFFAQIGNTFGDDDVVIKCVEGGHEALMDQLIKAKLKIVDIAHKYDILSPKYDNLVGNFHFVKMVKEVCEKYDYSGDVLDLGCGTGMVGKIITNCGHNSNFTGVDISPMMTAHAALYSKIYIGPMENVIYDINDRKFDHILSISCLHFLNKVAFEATLSRMFEMATKSITITIDEIPDEYNDILIKKGLQSLYSYNNKCVLDAFKIPDKWILSYHKWGHLWNSGATETDIYGSLLRFETNSKNSTSV